MTTRAALFTPSPLQTLGFIPGDRVENIDQELAIAETARKILTAQPSAERQIALTELMRQRATLLTHVPVSGIKGSAIFINMTQIGLPPSPLCPAYNRMQGPFISDYHAPGATIALIRLDQSALQHVPKEVLEKAGDLSGKQVDLFWTAVDGRPFANLHHDRPLNLCTHPWSHPHSLPRDDVKYDVNMGIFPEVGFQRSNDAGRIAINSISPMLVHTHENGVDNMRYSPDNAHFEAIPNSPIGILWSVSQKDNRVAITKMAVLFDYSHPICSTLVETIRKCDTLGTHLSRLGTVKDGIDATFANLIALFQQNDPTAIEEFRKLPLSFQHGIFKEAWVLHGSLCGVHGDFGKASFMNESSLDTKYHCDDSHRAMAIDCFAQRLQRLLVDSQIDLLLNSQTLVKADASVKMMTCARLLQSENEPDAMRMFQEFSKDEKEAVFFAIWEISKCPRGNFNFGRDTFFSSDTPINLKREALLLAASRQK